jgi:hypothetical protein
MIAQPFMDKDVAMLLEVNCQQNHLGNGQEPYAFHIGQRRLGVRQVQDRWLATDYCYFKVETEDGSTYILRHDERSALWEMILFQAA